MASPDTIPAGLWSLARLRYVNLADNQLTGTISSTPGAPQNFDGIDISGNNFQGALPAWLADFVEGPVLDLTGNSYDGEVPAAFLEKPGLKALILDGNGFKSLPDKLSRPSDLEVLSLAGNDIGPDIPGELLASFPHLRVLNLENNQLARVPAEISV